MKRFLFLLISLCFLSESANAQTDKGTILVGGVLDWSSSSSVASRRADAIFKFSPTVGYFFMNRLAGGLTVDWLVQSSSYTYSVTSVASASRGDIMVGPFARYYFTEKNIRPYGNLSFTLGGGSSTSSYGTSTSIDIGYASSALGLGIGSAFIVSEHVSIDALLQYRLLSRVYGTSSAEAFGNFGLSVGVHAYLFK